MCMCMYYFVAWAIRILCLILCTPYAMIVGQNDNAVLQDMFG